MSNQPLSGLSDLSVLAVICLPQGQHLFAVSGGHKGQNGQEELQSCLSTSKSLANVLFYTEADWAPSLENACISWVGSLTAVKPLWHWLTEEWNGRLSW